MKPLTPHLTAIPLDVLQSLPPLPGPFSLPVMLPLQGSHTVPRGYCRRHCLQDEAHVQVLCLVHRVHGPLAGSLLLLEHLTLASATPACFGICHLFLGCLPLLDRNSVQRLFLFSTLTHQVVSLCTANAYVFPTPPCSSSRELPLCPQCLTLNRCSVNVCKKKELEEG